MAYVVRRNGQSCDAETIIAHVSGQLARFKVPREIVFVDTLPRNALGKVQHFMLKDKGGPAAHERSQFSEAATARSPRRAISRLPATKCGCGGATRRPLPRIAQPAAPSR